MKWRLNFRGRAFHAIWIGVVLLVLAIWFDKVWIAGIMVMLVGVTAIIVEWLVSTWKSASERDRH